MIIDNLIEAIAASGNPACAGIDTDFSYLPADMREDAETPEQACRAILEFNCNILVKLKGVVPAVKVQAAYYEKYGPAGMKCFADTLSFAKTMGYFVIADVKRNDIGSTAAAYSAAYLGETVVNGNRFRAFPCDFCTVNGYLGSDGIRPFVEDCKRFDRGIFALVKTSNPSGGELQDRKFESGNTLYEESAELFAGLGAELIGKYGYSSVGAVVGATHREEAARVRARFPHLFFLIPGYGAQGGKAEDLAVCFDERGRGGIVNSSRGILCAYRSERYAGMRYDEAARAAASDMRREISAALKCAGKEL